MIVKKYKSNFFYKKKYKSNFFIVKLKKNTNLIFLLYNSNMYKVTLLVLLVILFYLLYKHQNEHFYRSEIYKDDDFLESDSEEDHFKYMDRNISEFRIKSDDYGYLKQVPELKFLSYDTCPNLYYLFHGIKSKNPRGKYIRGENTQGIQFRNDCEKYNAATALGWRVYRFTSDQVKSGMAIKQISEVIK